jgi:peptidoglycan-N-acetylglucosamine deacetylase
MRNVLILLFMLSLAKVSTAQIIKKAIPDKLVVLTFDDAPASHYALVGPMLKKFSFGATFFVCESPPNAADSSLYMNWRQIKVLNDMGFEIGNHTHTHANVSKLGQKEFDRQLAYIEQKCDSLGIKQPISFAYPGYGLNADALKFLGKRPYKFARAGGKRDYDPELDHPFLIPSWATNADNKEEILTALSQAKNGKVLVLTIHGVPDKEHPWVTTPPELFEFYLKYLKEHNFKVIGLRELEEYIDSEQALEQLIPDFEKPLSN